MRKFIQQLENQNELIRIREFVDPVLEIAEITDRISKQSNGGKALLFENTGTEFPLLINSLGSEKRICMALGVQSLDEIGENISQLMGSFASSKGSLWQKIKMLPKLKEISSWLPAQKKGKGLSQEVISSDPDLSKLPILKCWPDDGGRFVTLPLVNTVNPNTGARNVGMYRMQVFSKNTTGMHWHRHKTGARHFEEYKKLGRKMPVAVVIGGDIVYTYAATAPLPENIDEYIFAGFLRKKRVELVKCLTQDIWVPSDADFVIEGFLDPSEPLVWEGPFGDHTGFYSLADWYPLFHVTCITHRKDAVYPATIVGIPPQEDAYIAKATERIFLSPIKLAIAPEIIDMNLPVEGVAHNLAIVKINKTYPGQAFKIMNALWGAGQMMFNKVLVVTSSETDIFSPTSVFEAILKNANHPSHLSFQVGPADVLDHSAAKFCYGGKLCIDATEKMPEEIQDASLFEKQKPDKETIKAQLSRLSEVDKIDFSLFDKGFETVICSIKKTRKGQVESIVSGINNGEVLNQIRCLVFVDSDMSTEDKSAILWLVLSNIDPNRDCKIIKRENGICLSIDATRKSKALDGFDREWPSIIVSDKSIIKRVDEKWESLKIGSFLSSPSQKYIL